MSNDLVLVLILKDGLLNHGILVYILSSQRFVSLKKRCHYQSTQITTTTDISEQHFALLVEKCYLGLPVLLSPAK